MTDEETYILEDVEGLQDEQTPEEEEERAQPTQAPQAVDPRAAAYEYFRNNPAEYQSMLKAAQVVESTREQRPNLPPDPDEFGTYEEYFKAQNQYLSRREAEIEARLEAKLSGIGTMVAAPVTDRVIDSMMKSHSLPEEARSFLQEELAGIPPDTLVGLDSRATGLLARAARDYANEQKAKLGSNGRVRHAEPVAGVGPTKLQLADGVTHDDLNAYLALTGKQLDKATVAELRKGGYVK